MRAAIEITLIQPSDDLVHRFQNFGEDVYRALRDRCTISIDEIDRARDSFAVRNIRKRDLGSAVQIINRLVRQHGFEGSIRLVRLDRSES